MNSCYMLKIMIVGFFTILFLLGCGPSDTPPEGKWIEISILNEKIQSIYFYNENVGWVVGDSGFVSSTTDGGETWENQSISSESRLTSVYFLNEQEGLMTGHNVIYETIDGGENWTANEVVTDNAIYLTGIHWGGDNKLYALSRDGGIYQSNLLGESWENIHDFEGYGFAYLNFSEAPIGYVSQVHASMFYKTIDGGANWQEIEYPSGWSYGTFFLNEAVGWVTQDVSPSSTIHENISVYMTVNGGRDWSTQSTFDEFFLHDLVFVNIQEGWACASTKLLHTFDSGKTWTTQFQVGESDFEYIRDIFILDRNNGWALTSLGRVIRYSMEESSS